MEGLHEDEAALLAKPCWKCGDDGQYCWTCGEREGFCECEDGLEPNLGGCAECADEAQ